MLLKPVSATISCSSAGVVLLWRGTKLCACVLCVGAAEKSTRATAQQQNAREEMAWVCKEPCVRV